MNSSLTRVNADPMAFEDRGDRVITKIESIGVPDCEMLSSVLKEMADESKRPEDISNASTSSKRGMGT